MLTMTVRFEGVQTTRTTLRKVKKATKQMEPGFESVGDYLLQVFATDAFESEGAVYGKRWPELKPKYSLWKSTEFPGRGILEQTGEMRRGFKKLATNDYLLIHNASEILKYHNSREPRTKMPLRVVVDIQKKQKDRIEEILQDHIHSVVRKALK